MPPPTPLISLVGRIASLQASVTGAVQTVAVRRGRIFGVGVDVALTQRLGAVDRRHPLHFRRKCLSHKECLAAPPTDASAAAQFLSSRWAVKEALVKASGQRLLFPDITCTMPQQNARSESTGCTPVRIELAGATGQWFAERCLHPQITLMHDEESTLALAVIEETSVPGVPHTGAPALITRPIGVGLEVTRMPRFGRLYRKYGDRFLQKFLSSEECHTARRMSEGIAAAVLDSSRFVAFLASRWAVKAAASKAAGKQLRFTEMNFTRAFARASTDTNESSDPRARLELSGATAAWFAAEHLRPHVAISHDGEYAAAFAIIEPEPH